MSETRSRRWPLRLAQVSPLIALALIAVIMASMALALHPAFQHRGHDARVAARLSVEGCAVSTDERPPVGR